ncbi:MAG: NTP transferase domain-containing protein [Acidobacteriota bacterium]
MSPTERHRSVAGIVLAAGESTRMGGNKLLLEIDGETLVRSAVCRATQSGLEPVVVVLGHQRRRVEKELQGLSCEPIVNERFRRGIQSSVAAGIAHLAGDVAAAVIILADMPAVTAPMIAELIERYRSDGVALLVSRYGEVMAPPILYDRCLFAELCSRQAGGGKRVIEKHLEEAVMVDWPASSLRDIDTFDDYLGLQAAAVDAVVEER